jgi:hypothetical protein
MSVVLRCPHCGTTQGAPGECHACSEADVRYFCRNHDPGRWLDAPTCPACGARFGERPPPQPPGAPQTRRPMPRPDARSVSASRRTDRVSRTRRRDAERSREYEREAERERPPDREPPPSLGDVLERMLGSRRRRRDDSEPSEGSWETPEGSWETPEGSWETPPLRVPDLRLPTLYLKQFLFRLLWMGLVFVVFVIITMLFFVAGVMQTFGGSITGI